MRSRCGGRGRRGLDADLQVMSVATYALAQGRGGHALGEGWEVRGWVRGAGGARRRPPPAAERRGNYLKWFIFAHSSMPDDIRLWVGPRTEHPLSSRDLLARIARGQTNRLISGITSPLQGADVQNPLFSPLKQGRDPGSQTICLPPGYPGKVTFVLFAAPASCCRAKKHHSPKTLQGYLVHKKQPSPLEPP